MYSHFAARGALSSRRAASSLVRLMAGDERWEAPDPPPRLQPTTGVLLAACHDGFCGPRSDYVRQLSRVVWVSDRGLPCHEFEPSTTKDTPCRAAMHAKSVES
ncbi:hypothetical protein TNCV_5104491 [Trichonephila clavipes]|nr:hypothetical protein TNCV_5104491 [Trichonephila clavipes]